jgi:glycosyltransferase involved in cell wall biosynthesis
VDKQNISSLQIIVVDDNSQPKHKLLLEKTIKNFNHLDITLINSIGIGPSAARNTGINHARNNLLAFLDCDDEWVPEKLVMQAKEFEKNVVAVHGWCFNTNFKNFEVLLKPSTEFSNKNLINGSYSVTGSASCVMIRKEIALTIGGFNESLMFGEDLDMWVRASQFGVFKCLPLPLVKIAVREESSQSNLRNYPKVKATNYAIMLQNWKQIGIVSGFEKNMILVNRILSIASDYLRSNSFVSMVFFLLNPFQKKSPCSKFIYCLFLFPAIVSRINFRKLPTL